ncbi:MAG TPA: (2Fe-2S)-binding protein [Methylomirabilota bacterium]|jgi:Rieske Fe-S protein|nr:(2Fe-2S)-binding protein [Methylomirabilota bacterium]HEV8699700.1 (2Fe-2S)-binding protein [Candidatus Polarisedimenticolia bacterium]
MMRRRAFLGCGALAAIATLRETGILAASGAAEAQLRPGARAQLLRDGSTPLAASDLVPHQTYVFFYPFESTPCFLLDLGRPVTPVRVTGGGGYEAPGGVGKSRSIVAFSAICPHTYTHPTREHAMIHYFGPGQPATVAQRDTVITCCVHGSAFDPLQGAVPIQPPAELPLAAVILEWDEAADALYAVGVVGRPVFEEFFRSFPRSGRREVQGVTPVWELTRFARAVLPC